MSILDSRWPPSRHECPETFPDATAGRAQRFVQGRRVYVRPTVTRPGRHAHAAGWVGSSNIQRWESDGTADLFWHVLPSGVVKVRVRV